MKISIASEKIENKTQTINSLKYLNELEYKEIKNNLENIYFINLIEDYFKIVSNNYYDFINCLNDIFPNVNDEIEIPYIFDKKKLDDLKIDSNRKLINYLSSFKTLIDHILGILTEQDKEKFEKFINYLYDNYFSYRFLARFRDYSQHKGLPITNFESDFSTSLIKINLIANSEYLLSNYKKWRIVKDDLMKYDKIDCITVVMEHYNLLDMIYEFLFNLIENVLIESIDFLESIINEFTGNYELILLTEINNSGDTEIEYLPIDKIDELKSYLSKRQRKH